jgi:MATE family multidrug resistance protein
VINFFAIIPQLGWCGGIDTLCSNAFGAKQYKLVGIYTCIARFLGIAFYICFVVPAMMYSYQFFKIVLLQPDEICEIGHTFNLIMLVGIFFYSLYIVLIRYLQSMKIFDVGMKVTFISIIFHVFWAWLFIIYFDMRVVGAAISLSITQFTNLILVMGYIYWSDIVEKETYFYFSKECFDFYYIKKYLVLGVPSLLLFVVEGFSFEVMTIIASFLGKYQMSANVCIYNFFSLGYCISNGIGSASGNLIGNSIGSANSKLCYVYVKATFIFTYLLSAILMIIIYFYRETICLWYTTDGDILENMLIIFPLFVLTIPSDFTNVIFGGINKGLGRQGTTIAVWLFVQYVIGIPLMLLFTFYWDLKLKGLWIAQNLNLILVGFGTLWVYKRKSIESTAIDYKKEIKEIEKKKVNEKQNKEHFDVYNQI